MNIYGYPFLSEVVGDGPFVLTSAAGNLPNGSVITPGPGIIITVGGGLVTITNSGSGGGSVTSFSANDFDPLATANVTNATTTPNLAYTLINQPSGSSGGLFFAGPSGGSPTPPWFRDVTGNDLSGAVQAGANTTVVNLGSALLISSTGGGGSASIGVSTLSSNTNLGTTPSIQFIYVDASGGNVTLTLPAASSSAMFFTVKKTDSSGNLVIIQRSGSDTVDGGVSASLQVQRQAVTVSNDTATAWFLS